VGTDHQDGLVLASLGLIVNTSTIDDKHGDVPVIRGLANAFESHDPGEIVSDSSDQSDYFIIQKMVHVGSG